MHIYTGTAQQLKTGILKNWVNSMKANEENFLVFPFKICNTFLYYYYFKFVIQVCISHLLITFVYKGKSSVWVPTEAICVARSKKSEI